MSGGRLHNIFVLAMWGIYSYTVYPWLLNIDILFQTGVTPYQLFRRPRLSRDYRAVTWSIKMIAHLFIYFYACLYD
jgi:hypothetical protein